MNRPRGVVFAQRAQDPPRSPFTVRCSDRSCSLGFRTMRKRVLCLSLLLLSTAPQASAAPPPCDGVPVDVSLAIEARAEQLALRAFSCVREGKTVQAIALFSELIGIDRNNAEAYLNRGSTYVRARQIDAGLADYTSAIDLAPDRFEGWYNRGAAHLAARQYDEAIADLTEAIRLKPDLAHAYCNRGLGHLRKKEHAKARADFDKGLELEVGRALCYVGRGEIKLADRNYRSAVEDLTRGINLKPTAEALARRGNAYERLGKRDKALKDYKNALSLRPRLREAEVGIARLTQGQ